MKSILLNYDMFGLIHCYALFQMLNCVPTYFCMCNNMSIVNCTQFNVVSSLCFYLVVSRKTKKNHTYSIILDSHCNHSIVIYFTSFVFPTTYKGNIYCFFFSHNHTKRWSFIKLSSIIPTTKNTPEIKLQFYGWCWNRN